MATEPISNIPRLARVAQPPSYHALVVAVANGAVDLLAGTAAVAHSTNRRRWTGFVSVGRTPKQSTYERERQLKIVLIAPSDVVKRTLGAVIAAHFNIPHIPIGALLRDHVARRTDLGRAAQGHLDRGEVVPDELVLDLARRELTGAAVANEYLVEGMPRTLDQAREAYKMALHPRMTADVALHLTVDDEELIRLRRARSALERRQDDTEDIVRDWLELYHRATNPLVAWYHQRGILVRADAMRPCGQVGRELIAALKDMQPLLDHVPEQLRRPVDLTGLGAEFGPFGTIAAPVRGCRDVL